MSDTDSFIDEVTEEVRRDRLFALIRRFGWIAVAVVVLLVGGASLNEWRKAQATKKAQALGDGLLVALEGGDLAGRVAALQDLGLEGDDAALAAMLSASSQLADEDTRQDGIAALQTIASDTGASLVYRHLATLKAVLAMGAETPASDREAQLAPLAVPGQPFALLAQEQQALIALEQGNTDAALTILRGLADSTEATAGLRQRAMQLMVVLGEDPSDAS